VCFRSAPDGLTTQTLTLELRTLFEGLVGVAPLATDGPLFSPFHTFPDR
jgi:hypothetical protein